MSWTYVVAWVRASVGVVEGQSPSVDGGREGEEGGDGGR